MGWLTESAREEKTHCPTRSMGEYWFGHDRWYWTWVCEICTASAKYFPSEPPETFGRVYFEIVPILCTFTYAL
jgi:hypothetical protein